MDTATGEENREGNGAEVRRWKDYLSAYAIGQNFDHPRPAIPERMSPLPSPRISPQDAHTLYSSTSIDETIARRVCSYVAENDYLPPPRSPHESLREGLIGEYDIYGAVQAKGIQAAVDLLAAFFPGTLTTFTLFHNRQQSFFALAGAENITTRYNLNVGQAIASENSLCGHSVLTDNVIFVPDLSTDWRFRSNPYTLAGIQSYIGASISLESDPSRLDTEQTQDVGKVGIGVLNILFVDSPLRELSEQQRMVVSNIARMAETQIKATWEGHHRTRIAKERRLLADLIQAAFVVEQLEREQGKTAAGRLDEEIADSETVVKGTSGSKGGERFKMIAQIAIERLMSLEPDLNGICVVDISGVHVKPAPGQNASTQYYLDPTSSSPISILAADPKWLKTPSADAVLSVLNNPNPAITFERTPDGESLLTDALPSSTESHLAIPFLNVDQPLFLFISTSTVRPFPPACVNAIRSIGAILLARAIQSKVLEADAAKTAFLSSISHELRTPMHSIMTGLHLVREYEATQEWEQLKDVLKVVEASGLSLSNILNDVLDFSRKGGPSGRARRGVFDVLAVARNAIRMCLAQFDDLRPGFAMVLEYHERDWQALLDEAKFHRILINGLTNALKFCKASLIKLGLHSCPTATGAFLITVTDQGIGFEEKSLPRLLEPLLNPTSTRPSIGGNLTLRSRPGKGTTFKVEVPAEFVVLDASKRDEEPPLVTEEIWRVGDTLLSEDEDRPSHSSRNSPNGPTPRSQNDRTISPNSTQEPRDKTPSPSVSETSTSLPQPSGAFTAPSDTLDERLRVMIVDDNSICRRLLAMSLKRSPFPIETTQAANGQDAVDKFLSFRPDLVLTDVGMPVMDGITAAQRMRVLMAEAEAEAETGAEGGTETETETPNGSGIGPKGEKVCGVSDETWQCKIYAITGLGSSDPRLKAAGLQGEAALDGWLVKGQDDIPVVNSIIKEVAEARGIREKVGKALK